MIIFGKSPGDSDERKNDTSTDKSWIFQKSSFSGKVENLCECNAPECGKTMRLTKIIRRPDLEIKTDFPSLANELQTFPSETQQLRFPLRHLTLADANRKQSLQFSGNCRTGFESS
jgi:hypothetical protein